jgi:hypothetical protein
MLFPAINASYNWQYAYHANVYFTVSIIRTRSISELVIVLPISHTEPEQTLDE